MSAETGSVQTVADELVLRFVDDRAGYCPVCDQPATGYRTVEPGTFVTTLARSDIFVVPCGHAVDRVEFALI